MKTFKVKITAEFWIEVDSPIESMAVTNAELDVEDIINQKNWELDEVIGSEVEEVHE